MDKNSRIYIAGLRKIAGIALRNRLQELGYSRIISGEGDGPYAGTHPFVVIASDPAVAGERSNPRSVTFGQIASSPLAPRNDLASTPKGAVSLESYEAVDHFFSETKPEYVVISSGPPGGILANIKYPVQFSRENLLAAAHILEAAHRHQVKKLIYLGTSCTYPRDAAQPLRPEYLMTGAMEMTSRAHSTARLACMELCLAYRRQFGDPFYVAIPSDIFGPEDYFAEDDAHVIAALMAKMHRAKLEGRPFVELLGSGSAIRDFIYSRDLADAVLLLLDAWEGGEVVNISAHEPRSIRDIAQVIQEVVGFEGEIRFDRKSPDGTPEKRLDAGPLFRAGWKPQVEIREALRLTYKGYLQTLQKAEV